MRFALLLPLLFLTFPSTVQAELIERRRGPAPLGQLITADDYPPAAIRAGAEGRTVVLLEIDAAGRVKSCSLKESSGNGDLDEATCRVATRATFRPALDDGGRPVGSTYTLPVRWTMPKLDAPVEVADMPPDISMAVELKVGVDGRVASCRVLEWAKSAGADPCATLPPGERVQPPLLRDGRPIGATVVQRFSRQVTPDP